MVVKVYRLRSESEQRQGIPSALAALIYLVKILSPAYLLEKNMSHHTT